MTALLTIEDVCKLLGRSRTYVWMLRKKGMLRPTRIDRHRFERSHVESLLMSEENYPVGRSTTASS